MPRSCLLLSHERCHPFHTNHSILRPLLASLQCWWSLKFGRSWARTRTKCGSTVIGPLLRCEGGTDLGQTISRRPWNGAGCQRRAINVNVIPRIILSAQQKIC
jgi:hypothetical protein